MTTSNDYDVIIIGGSYSGLSAAMSLGRSLRKILVIDSGKPCNQPTPHSHNFITHDGDKPAEISRISKEQVSKYKTVNFENGLAVEGKKTETGFEIITEKGAKYTASKLLFATGLKDIMPDIKGFAECWGKSIVHCPYCHGYELRNMKTGILANGDVAFHIATLVYNLSKDLIIITNGKCELNAEQIDYIHQNNIRIVDKEVETIEQVDGQLNSIVFKDLSRISLKALYARPDYEQHCKIPEALGCELNENGLLIVDAFQKTTVDGVYASGDSASFRAVSQAVSTGTFAGAAINSVLC